MRTIVLLLAAIWCGIAHAYPLVISYQGFLTNPGGTPVDASVQMTIKLYDGSTGLPVHTETQTVPVTNGRFNLLLGEQPGNGITEGFESNYLLGVAVGTDAEMTPQQRVAWAPLAIRAVTAGSLATNAVLPAAQISGAVGTATKLATARTINGVAFDGTADISVTAGLTGLALGSVAAPTLSFSGDPGTGIFSPGTGQVAFVSNGQLLMHNMGSNNFAAGLGALKSNTTGSFNTASGYTALQNNTSGTSNTASGAQALLNNTTGHNNTASGRGALIANTTGFGNIAIGALAGQNLTTGSNNIAIGHPGVTGDSGTIRLGESGFHTKTYLAGNVGIGTFGASAPAGQLELSANGSSILFAAAYGGTGSIVGRAARGTAAAPSATLSGDVLAFVGGTGFGATAFQPFSSAGILFAATENFTDTARGGDIEFITTANGTSLGVERMRLTHDGNVGIGTASPLVKLHVTPGTAKTDPAITRAFAILTNEPLGAIGGPNNPFGLDVRLIGGATLANRSVYIQTTDFNTTDGGNILLQAGGGNVGIGTSTPTRAKVEIIGFQNATLPGTNAFYGVTGVPATFASAAHPYSLYADLDVAARAFVAHSDGRIKRSAGRSDAARDLATLAAIEITDYTYIDGVNQGNRPYKKVIAQQVEKIYPQAVSQTTDVVPDIYLKADIKDGWIRLATNLKKGERVRLIGKTSNGIHEVLEVAAGRFRTDFKADADAVFVYGREVKDFRSVDYGAIAMLNVSGTQELQRRLEQQAAEFAAQAAAMKAQAATIKAQTARIDAFEQQVAEIAMLKRQMAELHAAVLAAGRPEAARLAVSR